MPILNRTVLARLVVGSAVALALTALQANLSMVDSLAVAQTAPTPVPCVVGAHGVQIRLDNPSPGDVLQSGTPVVISGIAYDPAATGVPGISSVSVFLGNRDAGGTSLGNASIGQTVPGAPAGSALSTAGFSLRTSAIPQGSGARDLYVYAKSSVSNSEGVLSVPIFLNAAPTPVRGQVPTPVLPPPPACTPTPAPTGTPTAVPTTPPPPPTPTPVPTVAAIAPTPTPAATVPPLAPIPAAPPPAAPAPAAPAAAAPAPAPVATQPTAPRGGGIPAALGLVIVGAGAAVTGVGVVLRRRQRKP